jgi:glyoxylase-like metal-dependent hydrolase (beta-lactamase superfamily II)
MHRIIAVSLLIAAAPAIAQPPPRSEIRVERIAPGVAVLIGRGGNIGVSYGVDGNILIDDQYAPATEAVVAAIRTLDPDPIRFVINTHWHGDHTGGNENLGRAGTVIVAHDNVRIRMTMPQVVRGSPVPPSPSGALPVITFSENLTFHLNGDDIRAIHVDHAHTDGDVLIHWTRANVLHMGDVYWNGLLPFIDLDSGGSIDGVIAASTAALAIANETTVIIPGHGPVARRVDLFRYRDLLLGIRNRIGQGIAAGRTLAQIQAEGHADAYGRATDFITPAAFTETVYRSLTGPHGPTHDH